MKRPEMAQLHARNRPAQAREAFSPRVMRGAPVKSLAHRLRLAARLSCLVALAFLAMPEAFAQAVPPSCPSSLATADLIEHDFSVSFCELCGTGTVRMVIENPYRQQ